MGWTRRRYDGAGRLIEEATFSDDDQPRYNSTANLTGRTTIAYNGSCRTITDQAANAPSLSNPGSVKTICENPAGQTISVSETIAGAQVLTSYMYDSQGDLHTVTQGAQTRTFVYDSLGRLTSATNPESGTVGYTYDDNGSVHTRTDARNVTVTDTYDHLNRVTSKAYSDGVTPSVTYAYDQNLSIPGHAEPNSYHGRLVQAANGNSTSTYRVDPLGRTQSSMQTTGGVGYVFGYGYNNVAPTSLTYPSGRLVTYDYNWAGQVGGVRNGSQSDYYASGITYTPHGAIESLQFGAPNGPAGLAETIGYNSLLQPDLMRVGPAGTAQWNLQNFYCPTPGTPCAGNNGNVLSQTLDMPAGASRLNLAWAYAYDGANRLATAGEASAWSLSYGYDRFGNVSVTDLNSVLYAGQSCPSYDATTSRCNAAGFGYDAAGNMTAFPGSRTALYDAENRQYSLTDGGTTQYVYDGEGRRVQKVVGGQTTTYVYDAAGNLAAEYGGAAQTAPCTRCYVTVDHLGSTRLVMDAATGNVMRRYDYTPFGGEIGPSWSGRTTATGYGSDTMEPKFTGKQRDYESGLGLDYFGARYFSGAQGRFTTPGWSERPEPVPYADFKDTQSLNLYAYGRNNPLGVVDHEGHLGCGFLWLGSCPDPPPPASPKPPPAPSNPVYGTVDASGVAAATADKQQTDDRRAAGDPVEYGNSVFAIGGVAYTYTDPLTQNRRGTVDPNNTTGYFDPRTASLFDPPIPTGTQLVGEAHSHPDMAMDRNGDPLPPRDRLSGASGDKGRTTLMPKAQKYFQGTYVSLPDGRVIKYTPQGRISVFR